jgi:hypothetical protein
VKQQRAEDAIRVASARRLSALIFFKNIACHSWGKPAIYAGLLNSLTLSRHGKSSGELGSVMI